MNFLFCTWIHFFTHEFTFVHNNSLFWTWTMNSLFFTWIGWDRMIRWDDCTGGDDWVGGVDQMASVPVFSLGAAMLSLQLIGEEGLMKGGGKSHVYPLLFILSVGQSEVRGWSDWRGHKVVLSKKKFNMESPCISFYSFFQDLHIHFHVR